MPISSMIIGSSQQIKNFIIGQAATAPKQWHDSIFEELSAARWNTATVAGGNVSYDDLTTTATFSTITTLDEAYIQADLIVMRLTYLQANDASISWARMMFRASFSLAAGYANGGIYEEIGLYDDVPPSANHYIKIRNSSAGHIAVSWTGQEHAHIEALDTAMHTHEVRWKAGEVMWFIDGVLVYHGTGLTGVPNNENLKPAVYVHQNGLTPTAQIVLFYIGGDCIQG